MRISDGLAVVVGLTFASMLSAAAITTMTTCQIPGMSPVSGTDHCYEAAGGGYPYATASSSVNYAISGNELSVQFNQHPFGSGTNAGDTFTNASAVGTINLELETAGPVRSGYVAVYVPSLSVDRYDGYASLSINLGGYSSGCDVFSSNQACGGLPFGIGLEEAESHGYQPLPVTLGEDLSLTATQTASSGGDFFEGEGYADISSTIALEFFDTDGTTPVNVTLVPVPEPFSAGITVIGGFCLLGMFWRGFTKLRAQST